MALPKKGSRPLEVDGKKYRWMLRREGAPIHTYLKVTVETPEGTVFQRNVAEDTAVTPAFVRDLILDGKLIRVEWNRTGGDGRQAAHWKRQTIPEPLTLTKGKHILKLQFNQKLTALDAVILAPLK